MEKIEYDERILRALEAICEMVARESMIDIMKDIGESLKQSVEIVACDPVRSARNCGKNEAALRIYTTFKDWYKSFKKEEDDKEGKK